MQFQPSDDCLIFTKEGQEQLLHEHKIWKNQSYLLHPKLIDFLKNIDIYSDRTRTTCLGLFISNLFLIIGEDTTYDFSENNVSDTTNHNVLLYKYVNIFICQHVIDEAIIMNEVQYKPSYVYYIMLCYFTEKIMLLNFESIFIYDNLHLVTKYYEITEQEKIYMQQYKA